MREKRIDKEHMKSFALYNDLVSPYYVNKKSLL